MKNSNGFTLMEVILAITILSTLTVLTSTAMNRALRAKRKISIEVEDAASLRDAMRIIRNDINLAYNHYDYEAEILEKVNKPAAPGAGQGIRPPQAGINPATGQPFQPAGATPQATQALIPPRQNIRMSPATHFVGDEKSISFVTMNNGRISANEIQADFIEVGYSLQNCKSFSTERPVNSQGSSCLMRRTDKVANRDVTKGGNETVVLENVTEFSLKYLVEGRLDWVKEYRTEKASRNIFPDAVEVTLSIERELEGKPRKYSIQYVVPVHFPNNGGGGSPNAAGLGATGSGATGSGGAGLGAGTPAGSVTQ